MALTIAIDGTAGVGKSTIAKGLAKALGIHCLDTGAMYRALGLKALREGMDPHDAAAVEALCERTEVTVGRTADGQRTFLDGEDVSGLIRTKEVDAAASAVSKAKGVRRYMVAQQQKLAADADMVLEGRDIGTVVLPDATFKFFMVADPRTRMERRAKQMEAAGLSCDRAALLAEIIARDKQDSSREHDPLIQAEDALLVDTSALTQDEVLEKMLAIVREGRQ